MKVRGASLLFVVSLYSWVPTPLAAQASLLDQIDFVPVAGGLFEPTALTHAGDGSGRLFVGQRDGRIAISDGAKVAETFLDIRERVSCCGPEDGFLSLAFHPDYKNNGYFYVSYTDKSGEVADVIISRFRVTDNPNVGDSTSEKILLRVDQPTFIHQGGNIELGPDGFLYVSLGDGGLFGDPNDNASVSTPCWAASCASMLTVATPTRFLRPTPSLTFRARAARSGPTDCEILGVSASTG